MRAGKGFYLTLIFFPARMLLPRMPLSWRSFFTVVWFLSAISDRVSPCRIVTLFTLERLLRREELLRFVALLRTLLVLVVLSTSTKERLVKSASVL